jgi:hypothetical protein
MRSPCCLCVSVSHPINPFPEQMFMKLGMFIMAPVCMFIPLSLLDNGLVNTFPRQRLQETKGLFNAWFSIRWMSYQRKVGN